MGSKSSGDQKDLSQLSPPEVISGEDLLGWCQRVTKDYSLLKITDFRFLYNFLKVFKRIN